MVYMNGRKSTHIIKRSIIGFISVLFFTFALGVVSRAETDITGTIPVGETVTLTSDNNPYILNGDLKIDGTMIINEGVVLKVNYGNNCDIIVAGSLIVNGTEDNKVYITSIRNDDIWGDTNGDGDVSDPQSSDWNGITIQTSGLANIEYMEISYGNNGVSSSGGLSIDNVTVDNILHSGIKIMGSQDATVKNSTIDGCDIGVNPYYCTGNINIEKNVISNSTTGIGMIGNTGGISIKDNTISDCSAGVSSESDLDIVISSNRINNNWYGIIANTYDRDSTIVIKKNQIYNNAYGVYLNDDDLFQLNVIISGASEDKNDIFSNNQYGVTLNTMNEMLTINAQYNWWGDDSGPYCAATNPLGLGNYVSSNIDFSNFMTTNSQPEIIVGQETQSGSATPASSDSLIPAVMYSGNASHWFNDANNDSLTYSIVSAVDDDGIDMSGYPTIDSSTGVIELLPDASLANKIITLLIKANDGLTDSSMNVTLIVTIGSIPPAANQSPTDIMLSDTLTNENRGIGSIIGTLTCSDADAGDSHVYSLVAGDGDSDNSSFVIDSDLLKTNAPMDYEVKNSYTVRIKVQDQEGNSYEEIFIITIIDVDENPPANPPSRGSSKKPSKIEIEEEPIAQSVTTRVGNYIERLIPVPEGMNPASIITALLDNEDGTFTPIPTYIVEIEGVYYIRIRSLTESNYELILNKKEISSVVTHWSKENVNDLASRLIIDETETFNPDGLITRGEFAEYITKALGLYQTGITLTEDFGDVKADNEQAMAITIASYYGIISGYPDGTFRPEATITREEAMVMYARAMGFVGLAEEDSTRINNYSDKWVVAGWALEHVRKTISTGIFNGRSNNQIEPKGNLTYAEAATAIRNMLRKIEFIN